MNDDKLNHETLFFNGIDGATGDYSLPPMTGEKLSEFIKGESKPENLDELRFRSKQGEHYGLAEGLNPKNLEESGWGIIFAHDADPAIKEALTDLIVLRKEQAGARFRIYEKGDGYRPGEKKTKFLSRHNVAPGPVDPDRMPYYLLIVGSPESIPFEFQYQLDVQFAVGRIYFNTLREYANYAASVKAAESGSVKLPRQFKFFGVANPDDKATNLSADHLIAPLFEWLKKDQPNWDASAVLKDQATKQQFLRLMGGDQTPALLFSASHGMAFPQNDSRQMPHQGAILCQNWPGPKEWKGKGAIPQDFYLAGEDLTQDANLSGLIAFFFACYGGGTPLYDEFSKQAFKKREAIAPHAFLAGLPTRMLSLPKGGALAAIGHVERAWGYSFMWSGIQSQTTVFESALKRLMEGHPVGSAFEFFNNRYAELASDLNMELEEIEYGKKPNAYELAGMWTSNNDARDYIVIGDPAVRIPLVSADESPTQRPVIEVKPIEATSSDAPPSAVSKEDLAQPVPIETKCPEIPAEIHQPESESKSPDLDQTDLDQPDLDQPDLAQMDYGLFDMGKTISDSLKDVSNKLADLLSSAISDLTSLEIMTYTSDTMENAGDMYDPKTRSFGDTAQLKAYTRIELDGDRVNLIPEHTGKDGTPEIAENLWQIHKDMVSQAQDNRVAFVKALAEVAGTLLKTIK